MDRQQLPDAVRRGAIVAAIVAIPLALNLVVWAGFTRPARARVQAWRDSRGLAKLKPTLEALLADSGSVIEQGRQIRFTRQDPAGPTQALQRLAGEHRLTVKAIRSGSQETDGASTKDAASKIEGLTAMPIELTVVGSFAKIARWISDVEAEPGLQVESWHMAMDRNARPPLLSG